MRERMELESMLRCCLPQEGQGRIPGQEGRQRNKLGSKVEVGLESRIQFVIRKVDTAIGCPS